MINVSPQFRQTWLQRRNYIYAITIEFADGTKVNVDANNQLAQSGNWITTSSNSNSFPLGKAFGKTFQFSLFNLNDEWSEYNFLNAKVIISAGLELDDGTVEKIDLGRFTVIQPETYGATIKVQALDNMYKADKVYERSAYHLPLRDLWTDVTNQCGLVPASYAFVNGDYMCDIPEGKTCRQMLGFIAMLEGGNALIDSEGRVYISHYDLGLNERLNNDYDGGIFDTDNPYSTGDDVDGGDFTYTDTDIIEGGSFEDLASYHTFSYSTKVTVDTDSVVITQLKAIDKRDKEDVEYVEGSDDTYGLLLTNDIFGDYADALSRIGALIIGLTFRPFEIAHINYPLAEIGDFCFVYDRKDNEYLSVVNDIEFNLKGTTTIKCIADSAIRNSSTYASAEAKAYQSALEKTDAKISDYDKSVQAITNIITQGLGVFKTETVDPDTGAITYVMHNRPNLEDSQTRWIFNENGLMVSNDGGKTWNAGITAEGKAFVNFLSVIGMEADWIKVGTLTGITLQGNHIIAGDETDYPVYNESGQQIGTVRKHAFDVDASGNLYANNGIFKGRVIDSTTYRSGSTETIPVAVDRCYNYADSAYQYAGSAESQAQNAQSSADSAYAYAGQAYEYAGTAYNSALVAQASALSAADSATKAQNAANKAQSVADSADGKVDNIINGNMNSLHVGTLWASTGFNLGGKQVYLGTVDGHNVLTY